MDKITEIESKINFCASLINLTKTYCEYNYEKGNEFIVLADALSIAENNIKESLNYLDDIINVA